MSIVLRASGKGDTPLGLVPCCISSRELFSLDAMKPSLKGMAGCLPYCKQLISITAVVGMPTLGGELIAYTR